MLISNISMPFFILKVKNYMRPPHMNQCISLMSFDLHPLFLVS